MERRDFLVKLFLSILAFLFGYKVSEEGGVLSLFKRSKKTANEMSHRPASDAEITALNARIEKTIEDVSGRGISIVRFGAKPGTDCTQAIQDAIDYVYSNGGGVVTIPKGVFYIKPTETKCIWIRPGVSLKGVGPESVLKVVDDAGDYALCIGQLDNGLHGRERLRDVALMDFTLDQNGDNNTTCDIRGEGAYKYRQHGIEFRNQENCRFENLVVYGCGYNQIKMAGNSKTADSRGGVIKNCRVFFKRGRSLTDPQFDNTAYYIASNGYEISGCVAETIDPSHGRGGIELHGAYGVCANNRIVNYDNAIHIVADHWREDSHAIVANNHLLNCRKGVTLWGGTSNLRGIKIVNNKINLKLWDTIEYANTREVTGVAIAQGTVNTNKYRDISIESNDIVFEDDQDRKKEISVAHSGGIVLTTHTKNQSDFENISIKSNLIINSAARGIAIFHYSNMNCKIENVTVTGNMIINAASNDHVFKASSSRKNAIGFRGAMINVIVSNNIVRDTYDTRRIDSAIYMETLGSKSENILVTRNITADKDGNEIPCALNKRYVKLSDDIILKSPKNRFFKLEVSDDGVLSTTLLK